MRPEHMFLSMSGNLSLNHKLAEAAALCRIRSVGASISEFLLWSSHMQLSLLIAIQIY
jgi:hypothetical protein